MKHISVLGDTCLLAEEHVIEKFQQVFRELQKKLHYLDRMGIAATVTMKGKRLEDKLFMTMVIECADEEFKRILTIITQRYNQVLLIA